MKPNTLLISADGTYPGIVLEDTRLSPIWVRVKWYKWGYDSSDVIDGVERIEEMLPLVRAPEQVWKQFRALPPEYVQPYDNIRKALRIYMEAYSIPEDEEFVDIVTTYIMGLLK